MHICNMMLAAEVKKIFFSTTFSRTSAESLIVTITGFQSTLWSLSPEWSLDSRGRTGLRGSEVCVAWNPT